jgi:hypothetical protein
MVTEKEIPFSYQNGRITLKIDKLDQFDGLVMER